MIIISIHIRRKNFYLLCGEINLTGKEKRKFPGGFRQNNYEIYNGFS